MRAEAQIVGEQAEDEVRGDEGAGDHRERIERCLRAAPPRPCDRPEHRRPGDRRACHGLFQRLHEGIGVEAPGIAIHQLEGETGAM